MLVPPCKNCTKRTKPKRCEKWCEKWLRYKQEKDKIDKIITEKKQVENMIHDYRRQK